MSGTFQTNSIDWQIHLLQMRIAEWLDRLLPTSNRGPSPGWSLPEWFFRSAFWIMAALLTVWIGWQLYILLRPYLAPYWFSRSSPLNPSESSITVESLSVSQWLGRSRTFAQQGNYREACKALYLATLQKLDDQGLIPAQFSRTDGEYWQLLQTLPNSRPYRILFQTHERLCFGDREISQQIFQECEQAYREIDPV
ncbi:MAG: DUF4129 domain-containing protein [Leptodesmis sp.]|uniref:DUF4129 domain-containing protein n=1 Tax=Leptodesmis sp. TaxID=3100501 RepID=UPI003D149058